MRSRRVPLRSRKPWFRPTFLQGRGALRARTIRKVAVCLRPGTEIAFEKDAQTDGMMLQETLAIDWPVSPNRHRQISSASRRSRILERHDRSSYSPCCGTKGYGTAIACKPNRGEASGAPTCNSVRDRQRLMNKKAPDRSGALGRLKGYIRPSSICARPLFILHTR